MSKSWERPWSVEEIVENAGNWSLAGDAGLLKCMESLSEKIISQSKTTVENIDKMMDNLNTTSLNLDLVKNEFFSLQNTQFVESRVYEDDEVLDSTVEEKVIDNVNEDDKKNVINKAILKGLDILDKYYDKVTVPASDSEDDEEYTGGFILRPKDPYLHRPLPYIIGTEEWHKKWHVGLEESSSDSELEKIEENYSESDSDDNLPITDRRNISNSDSGTDISTTVKPAANSTFANTVASTDSEDNNGSISAQSPVSNSTFANELSNKLGSILQTPPDNSNLVVNKKPLRKEQTHTKIMGDFMPDQPPPLDDIFDEGNSQSIFSGEKGLFDDSDDESESIWNTKIPEKSAPIKEEIKVKVPNLFDDDDVVFEEPASKSGITGKSTIGGLFDDDLEDDLFSSTNKNESSKYNFNKNKYVPSFIQNEPPELIVEKKPTEITDETLHKSPPKIEKPGAFLPKRKQSSSESSSEEEIKKPPIKSSNLFSDSEDLYKDDLFTNIQKEPTSLFNDNDKSVLSNKNNNIDKKINLFDDEEESDDLFSDANLNQVKTNISNFNQNDKISKDDLNNTVTPENINKDVKSKTINLFDDSSDDDLFASTVPTHKTSDDLFAATIATQKTSEEFNYNQQSDFNFYNVQPPELDDWDTKSENNLFDDVDDVFENTPSTQIPEVSLFDKEPPSLDFGASQGAPKSNIPKLFDDGPSNLDVNFESPKPKNRSSLLEKALYKNDDKELFADIRDDTSEEIPILSNDDLGTKVTAESAGEIVIKGSNFLEEKSNENLDNFFQAPQPKEDKEDSKDTTDHGVAQSKIDEDNVVRKASPGKIKHTLNINVAALMPGSTFPKKKDLQASPKVAEEEQSVTKNTLCVTPNENKETTTSANVETLYSANKFRARGSQKRRPSTRRARQEQLKKSVEDEPIETIKTPNNNAETNDQPVIEEKSSIKHDIFEDQFDIFSKPPEQPKKIELFEDLYDDDIFSTDKKISNPPVNNVVVTKINDNKPTTSLPPGKSSKNINLFDDDDDEDDLFGNMANKIKPGSSIFSEEVTNKKVLGKKGSLFGDASDDDDMFSSATSVIKNTKNANIVSKIKKIKTNTEVIDDPLDALNK